MRRRTGAVRVSCLLTAVLMIFALTTITAASVTPADAKVKKNYTRQVRRFFPPPVSSSIVVDSDSGEVLLESDSSRLVKPASLTKMMTLYLVFEQLSKGKLQFDQTLRISRHATLQSPMVLGLNTGDTITLEEAVLAVVTKSANDAAVVIAENLASSETRFAEQMTATARKLGMSKTVFKNASGLPDRNQVTTARDMAILGISLIRHFPQYYGYFGVKNFNYQGVNFLNHNRLLGEVEGVDGIKTGYIRAAGFNLVASAIRNGRRVVVVVIGGSSSSSRDNRVTNLINAAFETIHEETEMVANSSSDAMQTESSAPVEKLANDTELAPATLAAAPRVQAAFESGAAGKGASVPSNGLISRLNRPLITDDPNDGKNSKAAMRKLWTIQVGAFSTAKAANRALEEANSIVPSLKETGKVIVLPKTNSVPYRARIIGLAPNLASTA
ncbi:MAG: D-alanyl-D-alanine carboxypeptidase, partial [Alphaproteobacteria bacterium]|nr:D-alanyl-D-alanine carboxypeptidase [Alphaproteobacteria bacterium]